MLVSLHCLCYGFIPLLSHPYVESNCEFVSVAAELELVHGVFRTWLLGLEP